MYPARKLLLRCNAEIRPFVVNCTGNNSYHQEAVKSERQKHPYRNIHPWRSRKEFINYLVDNVVYNEEGLVALNKPYGISAHPLKQTVKPLCEHYIVNSVDYHLTECLPEIAERLGHSKLILATTPEKYMSGITLLGANEAIVKAVKKSRSYAIANKLFCTTYWIVTTKLPNQLDGQCNVAATLLRSRDRKKAVPVLLTDWSNTKEKQQKVIPARIQFRALSNSTLNLGSLIEVKLNNKKWHMLRLFASTILYSPILGDNMHGSRIHRLQSSWALLDPFHPAVGTKPKLEPDLLRILRVPEANQEIIPVHSHLKSFFLPKFFLKRDILITSPLIPPFEWTCQQLQFKLPQEDIEGEENIRGLIR